MTARITPLADVLPRTRTIALGTFDGVHLGHREVIADADTVVTFDPHPMAVLAPGRVPPQLTTMARRALLAGELGVEELVLVPFDAQVATQDAATFVQEVLVDRLGARCVRVGENFRFGRDARGTPALLQADERFETVVVPVLRRDGDSVSSTRIRELVARGAVGEAAELLGSPFAVSGPVEHGEKRGRELGYPTANLVPPVGHALPAHGVYACRARLQDGSVRSAAVSIGIRPQFETTLGVLVEAYLLDFSGDLYGQQLELEFVERLRGEERFDGVEALLEQMGRDVDDTRRLAAV
ncbi:bifunctional riboflavin kinase/FAD synthetase [Patulibacter sp.]|uniref:bifunctional riboflavin kinase/FAD synthetase n=1 Tax=Patulibacter sp. TaxID=1912859 RepID=UPI002716B01F|nr:bifunctional riboflavin kinase/FAD synthetase [Patulibacter sp.]MDO9407079.1 bifunctional riboflavin kinase/FAD synthetase [Patulibacter sp.]